jgi:predicted 3-demethylubiquinone-9 3-methyltransferase (glyoxalase superfamily)
MSNKVTPFLWFDSNAEAAARFYVSLFPGSKITSTSPMSVTFELEGRPYFALNGGPSYRLSPAFSMYVSCKDQAEIDHFWSALLSDGGEPSRCGWLVDRFGLSWQVIPEELPRLISDPRGLQAMLKMTKIDLSALRASVQP